jgi:protein transport protein SEC24
VHDHTGNFHQRTLTDLDFGNIGAQSSFVASLRHDAKLDDRQLAFVQAAVLHTTPSGERRVRVMNLSIPVTSHIGNIFRFADFDACLVQILKEGNTGFRSFTRLTGEW